MVVISYGNNSTTYNDIYFHYGRVNGAANTGLFSGDFSIAPTTNPTGTTNTYNSVGTYSATTASRTTTARIQEVTNGSSTYRGSMYTAVATLTDGTPVIAWFDNSSSKLIFSYGNTPTNTTSISTTDINAWQGRAYEVDTNAGTHVDLAVDGADNVHLAYYNLSGGLHYAFIPSSGIPRVTSGTTKPSGIQKAKVDTYLSAGTKLMLNVRDEGTTASGTKKYVPYITYYHGSFTETPYAVRVAWLATTADTVSGKMPVEDGTDAQDRFTGKWEVMTVPAINSPLREYFICNGVPRTATGWVKPDGLSYPANATGIDKSILVGYMTDSRYEGATLKHTLWN